MTFAPINSYGNYLPLEFQIPSDDREFKEAIAQRERLTSSIVNLKETAQYETTEFQTGQQFFSIVPAGVQRQTRYTFRKVINFGSLPNAATKSVAHGIPANGNYRFTRIYATATDPTGVQFIPIPYATPTVADAISILIDATNVNITTGSATWTAFTECYVVLEYIKG